MRGIQKGLDEQRITDNDVSPLDLNAEPQRVGGSTGGPADRSLSPGKEEARRFCVLHDAIVASVAGARGRCATAIPGTCSAESGRK